MNIADRYIELDIVNSASALQLSESLGIRQIVAMDIIKRNRRLHPVHPRLILVHHFFQQGNIILVAWVDEQHAPRVNQRSQIRCLFSVFPYAMDNQGIGAVNLLPFVVELIFPNAVAFIIRRIEHGLYRGNKANDIVAAGVHIMQNADFAALLGRKRFRNRLENRPIATACHHKANRAVLPCHALHGFLKRRSAAVAAPVHAERHIRLRLDIDVAQKSVHRLIAPVARRAYAADLQRTAERVLFLLRQRKAVRRNQTFIKCSLRRRSARIVQYAEYAVSALLLHHA